MSEITPSVIHLTVDRREMEVPTDSILYASVEDKLCTIHLTNRRQISLFLTLHFLYSMLPADQFLLISRSVFVSLHHIHSIKDNHIILSDQSQLSYSRARKNRILYTFRQYIETHHVAVPCPAETEILLQQFHCFDHCPLPFFILEVNSEDMMSPCNFIFRYANEALAKIKKMPLQMILHFPFSLISKEDPERVYPLLTSVAFRNQTINSFYSSIYSEYPFHVFCYQPSFGFCACMLTPIIYDK